MKSLLLTLIFLLILAIVPGQNKVVLKNGIRSVKLKSNDRINVIDQWENEYSFRVYDITSEGFLDAGAVKTWIYDSIYLSKVNTRIINSKKVNGKGWNLDGCLEKAVTSDEKGGYWVKRKKAVELNCDTIKYEYLISIGRYRGNCKRDGLKTFFIGVLTVIASPFTGISKEKYNFPTFLKVAGAGGTMISFAIVKGLIVGPVTYDLSEWKLEVK